MDFSYSEEQQAIFDLAASGELEDREVVIAEGLSRTTGVSALTVERLEQLAAATSLTEAERRIMTDAHARLVEQTTAQAEVARLEAELVTIAADIERLRGHLQAMGGERAGDAKALVERLLAAEDQLQARRRDLEQAKATLVERVEATREQLTALEANEAS